MAQPKTCWDGASGDDNWSVVLTDTQYSTFEDPFSGTPVPKAEFDAVYGPACREVFQIGITVGLMFSPNPVMAGEWRFADEDARADLYDAAVEMKLVASFGEVCAGETAEQKMLRGAKEAAEQAATDVFCRRVGLKPSGLEVRGGIMVPPPPASEGAARKTVAELQEELETVRAEFGVAGLSGKRRKKLERRQRGILAALETSDEGIDRDEVVFVA